MSGPPQISASSDGLPHCTTCNDMRVIRADVPVSHPDFGKLVPCPDCGHLARQARARALFCKKQERIARYTQTRGRALYQTFDTFDLREGEKKHAASVRRAYQAALDFATTLEGWLILCGTNGTGKSHLAAAIANYQATLPEDHQPLTLFITAPDLLDLLRSGFSGSGKGDYHDLLDLCRTVDLLILDDLGVEKETDWAFEKLFQVLNHRYQAEAPTVIITNCRLKELEPRLYDRLSDEDLCVHVTVLAPSYRQRSLSPGRVVQ